MEITKARMDKLSMFDGSIHLHQYEDQNDIVVRIEFGHENDGKGAAETIYNHLLEVGE